VITPQSRGRFTEDIIDVRPGLVNTTLIGMQHHHLPIYSKSVPISSRDDSMYSRDIANSSSAYSATARKSCPSIDGAAASARVRSTLDDDRQSATFTKKWYELSKAITKSVPNSSSIASHTTEPSSVGILIPSSRKSIPSSRKSLFSTNSGNSCCKPSQSQTISVNPQVCTITSKGCKYDNEQSRKLIADNGDKSDVFKSLPVFIDLTSSPPSSPFSLSNIAPEDRNQCVADAYSHSQLARTILMPSVIIVSHSPSSLTDQVHPKNMSSTATGIRRVSQGSVSEASSGVSTTTHCNDASGSTVQNTDGSQNRNALKTMNTALLLWPTHHESPSAAALSFKKLKEDQEEEIKRKNMAQKVVVNPVSSLPNKAFEDFLKKKGCDISKVPEFMHKEDPLIAKKERFALYNMEKQRLFEQQNQIQATQVELQVPPEIIPPVVMSSERSKSMKKIDPRTSLVGRGSNRLKRKLLDNGQIEMRPVQSQQLCMANHGAKKNLVIVSPVKKSDTKVSRDHCAETVSKRRRKQLNSRQNETELMQSQNLCDMNPVVVINKSISQLVKAEQPETSPNGGTHSVSKRRQKQLNSWQNETELSQSQNQSEANPVVLINKSRSQLMKVEQPETSPNGGTNCVSKRKQKQLNSRQNETELSQSKNQCEANPVVLINKSKSQLVKAEQPETIPNPNGGTNSVLKRKRKKTESVGDLLVSEVPNHNEVSDAVQEIIGGAIGVSKKKASSVDTACPLTSLKRNIRKDRISKVGASGYVVFHVNIDLVEGGMNIFQLKA